MITEQTVLAPGLTAMPTRRGFVSVDLAPEADPIALTPEILDREKERLGCIRNADGTWRLSWRYRKEYLRDFTAQQGKPVFDLEWLQTQQPRLRNPLWRMDLDETGRHRVRHAVLWHRHGRLRGRGCIGLDHRGVLRRQP